MVSVFVEDELARTVVNVLLERQALSDIVNVELLGAAENSAVVLSGLLLADKDISGVISILDGDVFRSYDEKMKIVKKCLTGTDKKDEWQKVTRRMFELTLTDFPQKGAPEYNHKIWFEAIEPELVQENERAEFIKLKGYSTAIAGLEDWHEYYIELNRYARKENIEHTVVSYIRKYSTAWDNYIKSVREEISLRAAELQ